MIFDGLLLEAVRLPSFLLSIPPILLCSSTCPASSISTMHRMEGRTSRHWLQEYDKGWVSRRRIPQGFSGERPPQHRHSWSAAPQGRIGPLKSQPREARKIALTGGGAVGCGRLAVGTWCAAELTVFRILERDGRSRRINPYTLPSKLIEHS
jgi:hypothetical protein